MNKFSKIVMLLRHRRAFRAALSTQLAILSQDENFVFGGLTEVEDEAILKIVENFNHNDGPIIEFGTLFGITTRLIASASLANRKILTVDNFCWNPLGLTSELHEAFTRKILKMELSSGKVDLIVSSSESFRKNYSGPIPSLVFFDADHSYTAVKDEIRWAKDIKVPLICGHDYGNASFGVTQAVDEEFPDGVESAGMIWWKSFR